MNGEKEESNGVGEGGNPTVFFFFSYSLPLQKMLLVLQLPGWSLASRTPWDYALKSWQVNSITSQAPHLLREPPPPTAQGLTGARCSSSATLADEIMTQ